MTLCAYPMFSNLFLLNYFSSVFFFIYFIVFILLLFAKAWMTVNRCRHWIFKQFYTSNIICWKVSGGFCFYVFLFDTVVVTWLVIISQWNWFFGATAFVALLRQCYLCIHSIFWFIFSYFNNNNKKKKKWND